VKIDGYGSDTRNQAQAVDRVGRPASAAGNDDTAISASAPAAGDDVRLSSDARLMQAAMRALQQQPDTRAEVVARLRAALANGEIGSDPRALAETLIDRLLEESSSDQP
jgi:flagellar biosynthesis anti-sigma factor FlgM